jgi:hypothetical protein
VAGFVGALGDAFGGVGFVAVGFVAGALGFAVGLDGCAGMP